MKITLKENSKLYFKIGISDKKFPKKINVFFKLF